MLQQPQTKLALTRKSFNIGKPLLATRWEEVRPNSLLRQNGVTSFLIIPIIYQEKTLGTINLANRKNNPIRLSAEEVWLGIGKQMGLALVKAQLLQEKERQIEQLRQTEQALRDSEARYRTLAETAHDMIYILDLDDRILYVNRFAAKQFDVEANELIGKKRHELFPPQEADRQKKMIDKVILTGIPHYSEERTSFNGRILWLGTWLAPIYDATGAVVQVMGLSRDITAAKETENALRSSEQRFRDIIERSLDGYYFIDVHGRVLMLNRAFETMSNFKLSQMLDRNLYDLLAPDERERAKKIVAQIMGGKDIKWGEFALKQADGSIRWYGFNARRVMQEGIVIGMEGFAKDITQQKMIAEALQRSEARYRALFDNIPYEVFAMDKSGCYIEANRLFIRNWGKVVGRKATDIEQYAHVHRTINAMRLKVLKNQLTVQRAFAVDRDHGRVYYASILSPVHTEANEIIGLVGLNIDVTEQTITNEHLKIISKRLVQVQEEERARIAREIHDSLGQYLTALQLEISAALQYSYGESAQRLVEAQQTIRQCIHIASSLCYTLRPPLLDDFGLVSALKDHLREFQEKWHIPVHFTAADIRGLLSKDQETALFRVAQEALTNILKHAQAHHIQIELSRNDGYVKLTVSDDGRGFDYQTLQSHLRTTGFGLITMKERVELMGGRFQVGSAEGAGTKIIAELPFAGGV